MTSFYPDYNLQNRIQGSKLAVSTGGIPSIRMDTLDTKKTGDFQTVFKGMVDNLNKELLIILLNSGLIVLPVSK
jgi:hypothetical protein